MTMIVATGVVFLPFTLSVCAVGPTVEPLTAPIGDAEVTIRVPDSMTEGAIGKSIWPTGWAWWVVDRLNVEARASLDDIGADIDDTRRMRDYLLDAAQIAVRRVLNSYRWRLNQPQVHPVGVDPAQFALEMVHADGSRDMLPEPVDSFFFHSIPSEPPMDSSFNPGTHERLQRDLLEGIEPPHDELLRLDIAWLKSIGEAHRAEEIENVASSGQ
jgi:hypothetical protein